VLIAGRAAIDRYLLPAGPTAANPPHAAAAVDNWGQTDGQTDTVPLHKPCRVSNKCMAVRKVATPLRELTCHIGSHSVTCHPSEVTFPPYVPRTMRVVPIMTTTTTTLMLVRRVCVYVID